VSADVVLGAIVLGATGLVALFANADRGQARRRARESFRAYATSRGLRFEPPALGRSSPRVIGEGDTTDLYRLGGILRTRTSASASHGRGLVLAIAQRDQFDLPKTSALHVASLTKAFVRVSGAPADLDFLDAIAPTLGLLAERRREIWLIGDGGAITVSWRGLEKDPQVLDAARAIVVALAEHRSQTEPYR